ncbi:MAG: EAL domain-containing protein [Spirochaetales bacterium]|nr:EAL domain-containing protein [Spirochaetales bacterium]
MEYIKKIYSRSDILIQRKILVFFWSLLVLLGGSVVYLLIQLITHTVYSNDFIYLLMTIGLLLIALTLLLTGRYYISSILILTAALFPITALVWMGVTLNELKLYSMAFLQSVGILFAVLIASKVWQIVLYGVGAQILCTAFLFFRLIPSAAGDRFPYITTYIVVLVVLTMETLLASFLFFLLNKTLLETKYMAEHDENTGLPNGNRMSLDLGLSIEEANENQVHFYRIENYTELLLNYGMESLIGIVAKTAETISLENGRDVYRLSSDLLALFHNDSRCAQTRCMEKTMALFQTPLIIDDWNVRVLLRGSILRNASIENNMSANLSRGQLALYQAGLERKHFVLYEREREHLWIERISIFHELFEAVAQGHFSVVYQPLFNEDRTVSAIESLSRWTNRKGEMVSPEVFIPMLEQTGLMNDFFMFMVSRVLNDIKKYRVLQGDFSIFINLSPELINFSFDFNRLIGLIDDAGIPPEKIGFEITESAMLHNDDDTEKVLTQLKGRGFELALDDFGTGFSNFTRILSLPFSKIKFDRSFLTGMGRDSKYADLLEVLIAYLNRCSYKTVIEGVETEEDFELLKKFGCHQFQGFLLGRPELPENLTL